MSAPGAGGFSGFAASNYAVLNGRVFFSSIDSASKFNLFTLDPATNRYTELLAANSGALIGLNPTDIRAVNGRLYFSGYDAAQIRTLWTSDGSVAGTVEAIGTDVQCPGNITSLNGRLAFTGGGTLSTLYVSDGTAAGTSAVPLGLINFPFTINADRAALAGNRLLFAARTFSGTQLLFSSDGTSAGTISLAIPTLPLSTKTGDPTGFLSFGTRAAFTAADYSGVIGIWISDGTSFGTYELPGVTGNAYGVPMVALPGGRLGFIAKDASGVSGVYITDGTAAGTLRIPVPGALAGGLAPNALMAFGDRIVFDGLTSAGTRALFVSDGTAAGTSILKTGVALLPGSIGSDFAQITTTISLVSSTGPLSATVGSATVLATAVPSSPSDKLGVTLLSDARIAGGSTLSIDSLGRVTYLPGAITIDTMGADTLAFRVSDLTTGDTVDGVASVTLRLSDKLFDAAYYFRQYPDIAAAHVDPLLHFLRTGWKEGRNPSATFDTKYYLTENPDVAAAGLDPLLHYEASGYAEGRRPDAFFDSRYYLNQNPDVAAAGVNPLQHFLSTGWKEGRDPSSLFSVAKYLTANPDVKAARLDPLEHYLAVGRVEGRAAFAAAPHPTGPQDPLVDAPFYYAQHPDLAVAGRDASAYFNSVGWTRGDNPNPMFDTAYYLAQNPDVKAAGVNPLTHFETRGYLEGRDPSLLFSDAAYLAANPDVTAAKLDPLLHYLMNGRAEGRMTFLSGSTAPADPLVDAAFYDRQLGATLIPTGAPAEQQAAASYDAVGWQRGLNPSRYFDTTYYLAHNPDVAGAKVNPLTHFETSGWREGRDPSAQFSRPSISPLMLT